VKVLVTDPLSEQGLAWLKDRPELDVEVAIGLDDAALKEAISDAEGLIIRSGTTVTADILKAAVKLQVIGRAGIGVDNIDVPAATERGVVVLNTPDANATTTAELALGHLFSLSRRLPQADRSLREGRWARKEFVGAEISGKTIGVLGFGTIGRIVSDRCLGLKMRVLGFDPFVTDETMAGVGVEKMDLEELLAASDYVTVHCPLVEATRGLINAWRIAQMKPGARLINCARGGIVDESALLEALESGHLAGVALDVFEKEPPEGNPLLERDDVVATPHLGASTREAQAKVSIAIVEQVSAFLERGIVQNAVNLPPIPAEEAGRVGPWADLGRSLGRVLSAMANWPFEQIELGLEGRIFDLDARPLVSEILVGLLASRTDLPLNRVNAPGVAKQRGIQIIERRTEMSDDFVALLTLTVKGGGQTMSVSGALLGERRPRLVHLDGIDIEVVPEGTLLVTRHDDRPGIIGALGSSIAAAGINISRMQLGLADDGKSALAVLCVGEALGEEALEAVQGIDGIQDVRQVEV
jgi:D-3-phosphoglycerate dehydrogenase